jgi:hypothetical protein
MRNIIVTDADASELRDALDEQGLTTVEVTGPDGEGLITVGVPDDVDGIRVDLLLQAYASGRTNARINGLSAFAEAFAALDLDSMTTFDDFKTALASVVTTAGTVNP